jgi:predicted RNA-binding Zn ribbon-like protein
MRKSDKPLAASRPDPMFIADDVALDFLNSVAIPADEEIEWLAGGDDLISWLRKADLVSPATGEQIRANARDGELDEVCAQARALREWFRGFVLKHKNTRLSGRSLPELSPLNEILERDDLHRAIARREVRGRGIFKQKQTDFELRERRRWQGAASLVLPVAEAMASLVCTADFRRVKKCEGAGCTLLFLDKTRAGGRRWCSMAVCGNRAKQILHRERARRELSQHRGSNQGDKKAASARDKTQA